MTFKYLYFPELNVSGPSKFPGKRSKRKKDSEMDTEAQEDENSSSSKKKMRTTFTGKQIFELEKSFETKKYLSSAERAEMATSLQVTQQQVQGSHFTVILTDIISGQNLVPKPTDEMEEGGEHFQHGGGQHYET